MGGIFWLASYVKSGNTWFRVWLRNLKREDDTPAQINALDTPIASSRVWLDETLGFDTADLDFDEIDRLRPAVHAWRGHVMALADATRFHKVHDAYTRLADGQPLFGGAGVRGAIYIVRNPLDIAISYAAHGGRTIDEAIGYMADPSHAHNAHTDRLAFQVRQQFASWSDHVDGWTGGSTGIGEIAVHVVRYEDMHADPAATLTAAASFLGLYPDPDRVSRAVRDGHFAVLRAQEAAEGFGERPPGMAAFFREGRAGGWRDHLNAAQVARIVAVHGATMRRFGYLDAYGEPT